MADFKVNDQSAAVLDMARNWPVVDALVGGTPTMRAAGRMFLPQWPKEEADSYGARLNSTTLFNGFGHTTEVLSAKPFARPMTVTGLAKSVEPWLSNIDMLGTDIHGFSAQVMLACLRKGLHGVLVEAPKTEGIRTREEEIKAGVRPYLTQYTANNILGWRAETNDKGSYLTQLRLMENVIEKDGRWGETITPQVRVLEPGVWETWREQKNAKGDMEWQLFQSGTTSIQQIPFVFFYGLKEGFGVGKPPMLDLAFLNVEHWQSSSDQNNILHVARVPILFAKGFTSSDSFVIGSNSVASSMSPEAGLEWVEHTGQAIGSGRQSILDLEDRMRQLGAELTVQRPSATTATAVTSDDETNRSTLQKICEEFEDSLERCLQIMGLWVGEQSTPEVKVYKDFKSAQMSERNGDFLLRSADSGHISRQTHFEHMQRADVLLPNATWEEEHKRIMGESALRKQLATDGKVPKAAD